MKLRVSYQFEGRDRNYIVNPLNTGIYPNLEKYVNEFRQYFPDAKFEIVPEEIEFQEG